MAVIERFTAPGVYESPAYSQGVKVSEARTMVFLSGQVAYDKDGGVLHRGDFKGQAREVHRAIKALLEAAGAGVQNIVRVNTYVTDVRYRADLLPIRQEIFGPKAPPSTLVEVSALAHPDWLIEVEVIAVL
jgi:enamine deaminase RidA (YjgF/YER057c/UK114 family)